MEIKNEKVTISKKMKRTGIKAQDKIMILTCTSHK